MLIDAEARQQATDPSRSFIVQAPAGSGKTQILTQRFLRLLSIVQAPEQIIALTFTRKAASEMRQRIILALQEASVERGSLPPHQQQTQDYAKAALTRSQQLQWDLLEHPNRLQINTIDSLCQSINQAVPLMERHLNYSEITDKPNYYYLQASRNCLAHALEAPDYQTAMTTLLLHVDNSQMRLLALFTGMLVQRDHWLGLLFQAKAQDRATFERGLAAINTKALEILHSSLPPLLGSELLQQANRLACLEQDLLSPRAPLKQNLVFSELTQDSAIALRALLFTSTGGLRQSFDHHVGLTKQSCSAEDYKAIKMESQNLLARLQDYPDFLEALALVAEMPKPEYEDHQWELLQSLFLILPLLVGHLMLLFREHNIIDFTEATTAALLALGEAEAPTDLALYWDHSMQHLLVDEFQDTSLTQFELLSKLVQGWQEGDGRTLFIVGDPMQSIYRFRQAEVGLFFRAKAQGLGPVQLHSLALQCNFRSQATLVDWVNQHFANLFPKQVDQSSGAVSFHASTAVLPGGDSASVVALQVADRRREAETLIPLIQAELARDSNQSLALLVRSRGQLVEIIRQLRLHNIPYQGTEIDLLAHLPHIQDAWSLTQALLSPADRLAWLSVLRSPYGGLSLEDLHRLASFNTEQGIYANLLQYQEITHLSEEGRLRLAWLQQVLQQALQQGYQSTLSDWVFQTLQALHCDKVLDSRQLQDLEQFRDLLDKHSLEGGLTDRELFIKELSSLYSQQSTQAQLQIMTIHKSKGLEFDTVFLPGLENPPNRGDNPILRWLTLPAESGNLILVSPIKAAHHEHCALYNYLSQVDVTKSHFETQRLLYVAVTRAKNRLYLLHSGKKAAKGSFQAMLQNQVFQEQDEAPNSDQEREELPTLWQLPLNLLTAAPVVKEPMQTHELFTPTTERLLGVIAHKLLHWMGENHPTKATQIPWELATREFQHRGFSKASEAAALAHLQGLIGQLFQDPKGLWLIAEHHKERNEYALLVNKQGRAATRIIDRCFQSHNKQWLIDYKTGKEEASSQKAHRAQLNEYAYYLAQTTDLPIHCGIYYLQTNGWVEWEYRVSQTMSSTEPL